ncbi:FG-nucleoporin [Saccharomycopsis crataegensis]|uniref:FG-nucleoporin n=1 Tax=Saccharomycopsis crataegensis TaxID=43959 RepID=A0AAV5QQW6_9ASCO|nr:FG-nucleoporin [Saccharomycopsis crataegensis]
MFGNSGGGSGGSGFSFGGNSNTTSTGGGFSFGGSNNATTTTTAPTSTASGGLFGAKPSTGGFSFGNNSNTNATNATNTANSGTGLFGSNNANNNNTANNTAGTGGGLFGNTNNNTANTSGGGLFGNKTATATNTSSGGLFGGNNNTTNTGSGGLFGQNNSSTTTANKPTIGTGGGLFGNNNASTTTTTGTSGGLFGNTNNSTSTTAGTGSGLFGNNASKPTGGLFGNANNSTSTATGTGGGLFGNNAASKPAGGLFGNNNAAGTTATNTTNQTANGLFGATNSSTNNQPSFAWTQNQNMNINQQSSVNNPTINALQLQRQQHQYQQNLNNYSNTILEQLLKIKNSWDPNAPDSALSTYFYNKVQESEVSSYVKPDNVSQEEWNDAMKKRPDNNTFVPVKASGFEGLKKRSVAQTTHIAQSRIILKEIETKTKNLGDKHDLDSITRITNCKNKHQQLSKKLLVLGCKLSILKSKGYSLSPEEEILSENFKKLIKVINDPVGLGRLNELWSRLAIVKERSELLSNQLNNNLSIGKNDSGFDELHEEKELQMRKLTEILQKQQHGIQYLAEVLEADGKTLDTLIAEKVKTKK